MTPFRRLGLGARISVAFALGGLVLSAFLAFATLGLTREVLLRQRENAARDLALNNAQLVQSQLTEETDPSELINILGALQTSSSRPLLQFQEVWQGDGSGGFTQESVPAGLLARVTSGGAGVLRTQLDDELAIVFGVRLPEDNAAYFEAASLEETESNLRTLQVILFGAAVATTVLAALLGRWATSRMLQPLSDVSDAAEAIAGGRLDTRLDQQVDPELASLTSSFNDMVGALELRIERDARFASEVSHELRSPLMTLAASMEVLENNRDHMPVRAATAVDLMSTDISRFQTLVQDLLEISRFDAGSAALQLEPLAVGEFVRQATAMTDTTAIVELRPGTEETVINADKRRLAQVMSNLIENARKYGGGATRIEVSATNEVVRIAVDDAGPGVPLDERAVIFDRFSRGSAGGRRGADTGVGLGLALVDEHVRLHEGQVWVTDRPDGKDGARFIVELPIETPLDATGEGAT